MRPRRAAVLALAVAAAAAAPAAAGCGAGAGGDEQPDAVKLTVTDAFGTETLVEQDAPEVGGGDTVMRLLQRNAEVDTRYGGRFVQAIDGRAGDDERAWVFFVNGVQSDVGAAEVDVHAGDRIWWDRHEFGVTSYVPAVVGAFPEPFVHGLDGERISTRLECDEGVREVCDTVRDKLTDLGVVVGTARPGTEGGFENLRVLVGRWPEIRGDRALRQLERGPRSSGVFARVAPDGRTIEALDPEGEVARRLGPGTGLIAATRWRQDAPTWIVTGTDLAGLRAAAAGVDESVLGEKFALAIDHDLPVPLPVVERGNGGGP